MAEYACSGGAERWSKLLKGECSGHMPVSCIKDKLSPLSKQCPRLLAPVHISHEPVFVAEHGRLVGLLREPYQRRISLVLMGYCSRQRKGKPVLGKIDNEGGEGKGGGGKGGRAKGGKSKGGRGKDGGRRSRRLAAGACHPDPEEVVDMLLQPGGCSGVGCAGAGAMTMKLNGCDSATARRGACDIAAAAGDVAGAVAGLKTKFAFVGLTEHYDASVCLFHAMAAVPLGGVAAVGDGRGGQPSPLEFQNIHQVIRAEQSRSRAEQSRAEQRRDETRRDETKKEERHPPPHIT